MNMHCQTFTQNLDDLLDGRLESRLAGDCHAHAETCDPCRSRLEAEESLRRALRELPVPAPAPGYEARIFSAVRETRRQAPRRAALGYALAASLAVGVGIGVWLAQPEPAAVVSPSAKADAWLVTLDPNEVKPVRLVFRSPRALTGVTVHLQLPDGVELSGFSGQRELSWQADLQTGPNVLELPVIVLRGEGGVLKANLSVGQSQKQFSVLVQARQPAVLRPERSAGLQA